MREALIPDYNIAAYPLHEMHKQAMRAGHDLLSLCVNTQLSAVGLADAAGMLPEGLADNTRTVLEAGLTVSERLSRDFRKPEFGLKTTEIDGEEIAVTQEVVQGHDTKHSRLLHFKRETDRNDPKVYIIAPRSGHYSTLLRDTVRQLLPGHDVYINDWDSASEIPLEEGEFGLDDNVTEIREHVHAIGPDAHVIAVCQATVPALAAVAYMAQTGAENQPATLTLMGGPLDTRVAPTAVTELAEKYPIEWFKRNMVSMVPYGFGYPGEGRLVRAGNDQLRDFMLMNWQNHASMPHKLFRALVEGNGTAARKIEEFDDEYKATCDLDAKYYLEAVEQPFHLQALARGIMRHAGVTLDPSVITKTAVLTIEGGNDDISAPGQTLIAHSWLTGLSSRQKAHYLQPGVGHYGIFNGKQWGREIAPRIGAFMRQHDASAYSPMNEQGKLIIPDLWDGTVPG